MEKRISHIRGLDYPREKEKDHPGKLVLDLIIDMLKEEILNSDIKTYEVLLKIACAAKLNLVTSLI